MKVYVHIRDKTYTISVGSGGQTIEWLANVALLRFDRSGFDHISARKIKYLDQELQMDEIIANKIQSDSHVYLLLEGDEGYDDNLGADDPDELNTNDE